MQSLCEDHRPFGGKIVLLSGDFRQILPVVSGANRGREVQACIKSSALWRRIIKFPSEEIQDGDALFAQWQLDVGNGAVAMDNDGNIAIPDEFIFRVNLVNGVFGQRIVTSDFSTLDTKIILAPTNEKCFGFNNQVMELFPGRATTVLSIGKHEVDTHDEHYVPTE